MLICRYGRERHTKNKRIHTKTTQGRLEKHKSEIEVFYLPPYAPEYNPDELLNSDLKRGISKRPSPRSEKELEHNVRSHLKFVQLRAYKIRGFFGSKTTAYAAYFMQGLFGGAIIISTTKDGGFTTK